MENNTSSGMAGWVWPLDKTAQWAKNPTADPGQMVTGFLSLNRYLAEKAGDAEVRPVAIEATRVFLVSLGGWVKDGDLTAEQMQQVFGMLNTLLIEAGPYRYETKSTQDVIDNILEPHRELREAAVEVYKAFLGRSEFDPIRSSIEHEVLPLLETNLEPRRFMPFRLIQVGKLADTMANLAMWLSEGGHAPELVEMLNRMAELKYPRFGTSGFRGRWQEDFTEVRARRVAEAIMQYLADTDIPDFVDPREDLGGKWIVISYDGRRNSPLVASWLAETALAYGFRVQMASRPTPTPALAYYATEVIGKDNLAGMLNCTASHNPSDWQGIKFNPREGYPAPSHLTNLIASRINEMQLLDLAPSAASIDEAEAKDNYTQYDPLVTYWDWIRENGDGNKRIAVDFDAIKDYFGDKLVLIDEMHGAGRGYMQHIFGDLGLRFNVLHATRDIDLGGLAYANPERPFIDPLIDAVAETGAALGIGLDTDADRFGVVDEGGEYFRPNQILAMLSHYLGKERGLEGRLVVTQTGLPMIDELAGEYAGLERPADGVVPPYVGHRFYIHQTGARETMEWQNVFVVPVGIKYIVEIPRMDTAYRTMPESDLPPTWMDGLLLGGEESSGLTTRGHVPDKDGLWANLLIMDMIAYYKKPLKAIWQDLVALPGAWESFGGRVDIDASDAAKEGVISHYIDLFEGAEAGEIELAGCPVLYAGGTRYDMAEIFLGDEDGRMRHFLRVRASGTEPINRVYTETADPDLWEELQEIVLNVLDTLSIEEIGQAYRIQRLADILTVTQPANPERVAVSVREKLGDAGWTAAALREALETKSRHVEKRNRKVIESWLERLD